MHNKKRKHIKRSASVLHEGIRKSWNVRGLRKEGQTRHLRYITPRSRDPRAVAGKQNPTTRNRPPSRQASNHIQISPSARHHLHSPLLVIIHPPKSLPPTSLRSIRPRIAAGISARGGRWLARARRRWRGRTSSTGAADTGRRWSSTPRRWRRRGPRPSASRSTATVPHATSSSTTSTRSVRLLCSGLLSFAEDCVGALI